MLVPDITMYMNLWLVLATFASLQPRYREMGSMPESFRLIANDLIKLFNQNPRWNATELDILEATNISVGIAVLKVKNEKFIGDIGDIIRARLQEGKFEPSDLPNLAKSTKYMREFKYSRDLYSQVHATALTLHTERRLPDGVFEDLCQIYKEHGIMTDSPFV